MLLKHEPDMQVAARTNSGWWWALRSAAVGGYVDCVSLLLSHSPLLQDLDMALQHTAQAARTATTPTILGERTDEEVAGGRRGCISAMIAKGAKMPDDATKADRDFLWSIVQDLAAQALVPRYANEAVIGLALDVERTEVERKGLKRKAPDS